MKGTGITNIRQPNYIFKMIEGSRPKVVPKANGNNIGQLKQMLLVFRIHRDESHSVSYILASGKRIFSLVCPSQGVNPQYLLH